MKRRVLKPWVEKTLTAIELVLFAFLVCVNDFTFTGFFVMLGGWVLFGVIFNILVKYGRCGKEFFNNAR